MTPRTTDVLAGGQCLHWESNWTALPLAQLVHADEFINPELRYAAPVQPSAAARFCRTRSIGQPIQPDLGGQLERQWSPSESNSSSTQCLPAFGSQQVLREVSHQVGLQTMMLPFSTMCWWCRC